MLIENLREVAPNRSLRRALRYLNSFKLPSKHQLVVKIDKFTPPKIEECPLKRDYFNRKYIFQPLMFRGHISFPGIIQSTIQFHDCSLDDQKVLQCQTFLNLSMQWKKIYCMCNICRSDVSSQLDTFHTRLSGEKVGHILIAILTVRHTFCLPPTR